ncbi:putative secreted protein (Por secretion system target) [Neolewinella xylanilytica]|uniref:Putative secreted protein (Por secretion system target) n=1 Tax=Neolewinella xylanilytica TaxID=1514080 RepID=A0A2S6I562_9BACT|nr:PQQ-dependent sugar dehydrogenase [Neolewinella xylanilytica]PPK86282.1 putative secreted protein (Por secretion system target) [Neolewinella xylanilytica]
MRKRPAYFLFFLLGTFTLAAQPDLVLEVLDSTFTQPTDLASDGVNEEIIYIVEKQGLISRYDLRNQSVAIVLDLTGLVDARGEGGALGMAFHPNYPDSNYLYVNYTSPAEQLGGVMTTRISRFTLDNAGIVEDVSERILLRIPQPATNHNAGDLAFGPDGLLYIPTGDGGGADDEFDNAQDPTSLLGKMLRIDVDSTTATTNYVIPATNPYDSAADTLPEIWAMGLRNPWRISFDRESGGLWIGDVGQGVREEVNYLPAGEGAGTNFGWNCREGFIAFSDPSSRCDDRTAADFTEPVLDYAHDNSERVNGLSITGGFVYRGPAEDLRGYYVFGDFVRQRLFLYPTDVEEPEIIVYDDLATTAISTFGEGADGELYVADFGGTIYRVTTESATSVRQAIRVENNLRLYPNPTTDLLTVQLPAPFTGTAPVEYISPEGRTVATVTGVGFAGGKAELRVPDLAAGVYTVAVVLGGSRYVSRLVVQ